jgi:hypothetical protein
MASSSMITYAFLGITTLIITGIYVSYCVLGFDTKPLFDEMVEKWKQAKMENKEPEMNTTYFDGFMSGLFHLVMIFIVVMASITLLKMGIVKGPPKLKDFTEIVIASLISVFIIVGLTMAAVRMLPILGRTFENTVGYFGINTFGGLENIASSVFTNTSGSDIKYGVLATKMFDSGFLGFLNKMKTAETSPIKGILLKKEMLDFGGELNMDSEEANPIFQLFKPIALKHKISEATWISLATVLSLFSGFIMIKYSGIRKKL